MPIPQLNNLLQSKITGKMKIGYLIFNERTDFLNEGRVCENEENTEGGKMLKLYVSISVIQKDLFYI